MCEVQRMKESGVFEDLEKIAEQNKVKICNVNLKKYSYYIKSGICKVKGEYRVILDKHLHLSEKIDVLIDSLQTCNVETDALNPYLKRLFEKKGTSSKKCFSENTLPGGEH
ncbi:MAG: hypothetical protein WCQ99_00815 [Pseudomonadota bacterium]